MAIVEQSEGSGGWERERNRKDFARKRKSIECRGFLIERRKPTYKGQHHIPWTPRPKILNGYWFYSKTGSCLPSRRYSLSLWIFSSNNFSFECKTLEVKYATKDFNDGAWSEINKSIDTLINPLTISLLAILNILKPPSLWQRPKGLWEGVEQFGILSQLLAMCCRQ